MRTLMEIDAELAKLRAERDARHVQLVQLMRERDRFLLTLERDKIDQAIAQVVAPPGIESGERGMGEA